MSDSKTIQQRLFEPFDPWEVEWRVRQSGMSNGKPWAKVLAYIANRAIMNRLDDVIGIGNWKNEFQAGPLGGVMCGISIRAISLLSNGAIPPVGASEWVTKWDVAANTKVMDGDNPDDDTNIKGGFSASMKRAAVQWGMGRYLYYLEEGFANATLERVDGWNYAGGYDKKAGQKFTFYWNNPGLPEWALPGGTGKPAGAPVASKPRPEAPSAQRGPGSSGEPSQDGPSESAAAQDDEERGVPSGARAPSSGLDAKALAARDITKEDMDKALARAEAIGCSRSKFSQAFILYMGKATVKGQIDYKAMTRRQYNVVWKALESMEALNQHLNKPPKADE
jgi:hypothetical protein